MARLFPLGLVLLTVQVTARPRAVWPQEERSGFKGKGRSGSIDDGNAKPLALAEFEHFPIANARNHAAESRQFERLRGTKHRRPSASKHKEYPGPIATKHRRPTPSKHKEYPGPIATKHRRPTASKHKEYPGPIATKHRENAAPVVTKHRESARPTGNHHRAQSAPSDKAPQRRRPAPQQPAQPPAKRPFVAMPRARPARIRPHPKGRITINGKEEPVIAQHGKVHSCKNGFQWDKCNAISHNLKCEICFPRVPLKFELCQESHRGNSKRCLEALYWMFKQKVNSVKRRFPHWRRGQGQDSESRDDTSGQTGGGGRIGHSRFGNKVYSRRKGYHGSRFPDFTKPDDAAYRKGEKGAIRKRV